MQVDGGAGTLRTAADPPDRGRRRTALRTVVGLALLVGSLPVPVRAGPIRELQSFPRAGTLYADPGARLLYEPSRVGNPKILIRDLDTLRQRKTIDLETSTSGTFMGAGAHLGGELAAVDSTRHRLFYPYRLDEPDLRLAVIDGKRATVRSLSLPAPEAGTGSAAFSVEALAYSAPHDALYILYATPPGVAGLPEALTEARLFVQEIDPASGTARWSLAVPVCTGLFRDGRAASPLGRGRHHLYVGCLVGGTATNGAMLRIALDGAGEPVTVESFLTPGIPNMGLFDPASERTFILRGDGTAVAVFDGIHGDWIGIVPTGARPLMGSDETRGRVYLCGQRNPIGGLLITDAGVATPAPPGAEFPELDCSIGISGRPLVVDPPTRRIFLPREEKGAFVWQVVHDGTPSYSPPPDFDPDADALDVDEKLGTTDATFAGQGSAYGTRLVWVGGPLEAVDNVSILVGPSIRENGGRFGIRPAESSREVRLARVASAKLTKQGLQAAAISADRDDRVEADFEMLRVWQKTERERMRDATCRADPTCLDTTTTPTWPEEYSECFAFGGGTDRPRDARNGSSVRCDFDRLALTAAADGRIPATREVGDALASLKDTVSIGDATATVKIHRDPKLGVVATTSSASRNVVIAGRVFIAEATATAKAWAAGRPGRANTEYKRTFAGVKVLGPDGEPVYLCRDDGCVPSEVVAAINEALGPRIIARLPQPDGEFVDGSERGTTAIFKQDSWEQIQEQVLFDKPVDDLTMPALELQVGGSVLANSGVIVQLAGAMASAGYRISLLPRFDQEPPVTALVEGLVQRPPPPPAAVGSVREPRLVSRTVSDRIRTGTRWVFGWGNGFLGVLAGWALLLSPLYVALRRRVLLRGTGAR